MNAPAPFALVPRILKKIWFQILLLGILLSAHIGLEFLPKVKEHDSFRKILSFTGVWIVAWGVRRILGVLKDSPFVGGKISADLRGIVFTLLRVALFALAFLVALDTIGISITPLIASLGVGSIALGLALQDTLGNLISGAYLYLDRPVAVGDWIRLDAGIEGQVMRIGWRTTRILSLDNMVVIPNSKLSSAMLTNLNLPLPEIPVSVTVGVSYTSDLARVEQVLMKVGDDFRRNFPLIASEREAVVRFLGFGDSSINVNLVVRVRAYPDQILAKHEVVKAIKTAFDQEKIEIPYPHRVVMTTSIGT